MVYGLHSLAFALCNFMTSIKYILYDELLHVHDLYLIPIVDCTMCCGLVVDRFSTRSHHLSGPVVVSTVHELKRKL